MTNTSTSPDDDYAKKFCLGVELAEQHLIGTCKSLSEFEDEYDNESKGLLDGIDSVAFCCAGCGWWCEVGEAHDMNGEDVCGDCCGEEDDD